MERKTSSKLGWNAPTTAKRARPHMMRAETRERAGRVVRKAHRAPAGSRQAAVQVVPQGNPAGVAAPPTPVAIQQGGAHVVPQENPVQAADGGRLASGGVMVLPTLRPRFVGSRHWTIQAVASSTGAWPRTTLPSRMDAGSVKQ
jgi:hypothetical protein